MNPKHPRKLAKRIEVTDQSALADGFEVRLYCRHGQILFMMSIIDVHDRCIVGYHIGLNALALDALRTLRQAPFYSEE